jgi:hypothetical protein
LATDDGGDVPRALGVRNARLMALHGRLFGAGLELLSICPQCATTLEFSPDSAALAAALSGDPGADRSHVLEVDGYRIEFRLPDAAAVADAAQGDAEGFEDRLLRHCVVASAKHGAALLPEGWPAPVRDALSARMDVLDPGASVSFDLECPACAARWQAPFDIGQALWRKLQAAAEQVLLDVDTLARAYGWSEGEVLSLSPMRRAAYLQMALS